MDTKSLLWLPKEKELLTEKRVAGDEVIARRLRPQTWDEYVGHEQEKLLLVGDDKRRGLLTAAKDRDEVADHILLSGPAGLGKTAMSTLIQRELGYGKQLPSGMSPAMMQSSITSLHPRDVIFIDEIHSLKPSAMESVQIGMEGGVVAFNRFAPPFTLIGATTRFGKLQLTLRVRFGLVLHLNYYSEEEIVRIGRKWAAKLDMELRTAAAEERSAPR